MILQAYTLVLTVLKQKQNWRIKVAGACIVVSMQKGMSKDKTTSKNCLSISKLFLTENIFIISQSSSESSNYSIKTHGSESRGQERAKRSPKTKCATNYCVSFTRANIFVI